jgi:hypothetical protein
MLPAVAVIVNAPVELYVRDPLKKLADVAPVDIVNVFMPVIVPLSVVLSAPVAVMLTKGPAAAPNVTVETATAAVPVMVKSPEEL